MTPAAKPLSGMRILVLEEQYFVAQEVASLLAGAGATVLGPVGALPVQPDLAEAAMDFALLDVNIRNETVFAFADQLSRRGVPMVLMTGYGRHTLPGRFRDLPLVDKPVDASRLAAAVLAAVVAKMEGGRALP